MTVDLQTCGIQNMYSDLLQIFQVGWVFQVDKSGAQESDTEPSKLLISPFGLDRLVLLFFFFFFFFFFLRSWISVPQVN